MSDKTRITGRDRPSRRLWSSEPPYISALNQLAKAPRLSRRPNNPDFLDPGHGTPSPPRVFSVTRITQKGPIVHRLFANAPTKLRSYDATPKARRLYNPAAREAYRRLATGRMPQTSRAWSALGKALMAFDMYRQLGAIKSPQSTARLANLRRLLTSHAPQLRKLLSKQLSSTCIARQSVTLRSLFDDLSATGYVVPGKRFPVGTSKALHFMNPELFMIIDKRVASKLHRHTKALPSLASNYTGGDYVLALTVVSRQLSAYGITRLRRLQPAQPLMRIVDKILFM